MGDTWDVRELDPSDEPALRRWWEVGKAADAVRPYDFYWPWESAVSTLTHPRADTRMLLLGAYDASGVLWGSGQVDLPQADNTHAAFAEYFVHPDRQRQGAGRALVTAGEVVAREAGRRVVMVEAYAPPEGDSAALLFARAMGYTEAIVEGIKVLDLVATEPTWAGLAEAAAPHHADYRLVTWQDVVPGELLDGYCRMNEAFNEEAPLGDLDLEAEKWDAQRVRDREARYRRADRHLVATLALTQDGSVVGATEVVLSEHTPAYGFQSGTLVLPGHRGHRLGLAVKIANQRAVRARFPECAMLVTGNAGMNAPMNAVNDALGYRYVERCVEVQKRL